MGPWFPFESAAHMDFVCWSVSGSPVSREKTDSLHKFLSMYTKQDVVDDLPTSYKAQKRWQDKMLPTLALKSHKVKVRITCSFCVPFESGYISAHPRTYPDINYKIFAVYLVQVEEPMDYSGPRGVAVNNDITIHMANLASVIQLMYSNPSTKWDDRDEKKGLRSFANTPFAQVVVYDS